MMIIILMLLASSVFAQKTDSTLISNYKIFAYPFVFYTPETELGIGAGGIYYFHNLTNKKSRPSSITFSGYYTTNKQYSFEFTPKIYIDKEKYYLNSKFSSSKLEDEFYGTGSTAEKLDNPDYLSNIISVYLDFRKLFPLNFQIGIIYDAEHRKITDIKSNPVLYSGQNLGIDGGYTSGAGIIFCFDSRDNLFYPSSGFFYELSFVFYQGFIGSEYIFNRQKFDFKNYFSLSDQIVFASQLYAEFLNGSPPFYKLPQLGGDRILRGYFKGRFRDKNYYALQTEIRTHIWKKFGGVMFFSLGDVSPNFHSFKLKNTKYTYGIGLRYRIDNKEKIDIRADIGFAKRTSGIYFGIEQAF